MMVSSNNLDFDMVVIGSGFGGMYMIHRARQSGLSVRAFEAGPGIGGVWFWNGYPGARCDVESMQYSYGFDDELQQEWKWSEKFSPRDEILKYANHVADRLDLRKDIQLNTRITSAHYDGANNTWQVTTQSGESFVCRYLVMATGALSSARIPPIPGLDDFQGEIYHTGDWPQDREVDFTGKTVAVIGTGSSGIQVITAIAPEVEKLTVYQRTPNYSVPMRNRPMTPEYEQEWKSEYPQRRYSARYEHAAGTIYPLGTQSALDVSAEEREAAFERIWEHGTPAFMRTFTDITTNMEANHYAAEFVRSKIRGIVKDPEVANKLIPQDYPIGTKRICVDTDYFEVYNRDNVELISVVEDPIVELTETGIKTQTGAKDFDAIVFATGYDAITGALNAIDIRGRDGTALKEMWANGPEAYIGLMVHGFPNMFILTGPGSPSVLSNVINALEHHVEFVGDAIDWMHERDLNRIEPSLAAQSKWADFNDEVANSTLMVKGKNSWYMGANIDGIPKRFMPFAGGINRYANICLEIVEKGYEGFNIDRADAPVVSAAQ